MSPTPTKRLRKMPPLSEAYEAAFRLGDRKALAALARSENNKHVTCPECAGWGIAGAAEATGGIMFTMGQMPLCEECDGDGALHMLVAYGPNNDEGTAILVSGSTVSKMLAAGHKRAAEITATVGARGVLQPGSLAKVLTADELRKRIGAQQLSAQAMATVYAAAPRPVFFGEPGRTRDERDKEPDDGF